jgi:hypothetical protein
MVLENSVCIHAENCTAYLKPLEMKEVTSIPLYAPANARIFHHHLDNEMILSSRFGGFFGITWRLIV